VLNSGHDLLFAIQLSELSVCQDFFWRWVVDLYVEAERNLFARAVQKSIVHQTPESPLKTVSHYTTRH
jgi:hypothetical protein